MLPKNSVIPRCRSEYKIKYDKDARLWVAYRLNYHKNCWLIMATSNEYASCEDVVKEHAQKTQEDLKRVVYFDAEGRVNGVY